jgi:hypothetical protein
MAHLTETQHIEILILIGCGIKLETNKKFAISSSKVSR